MEQKTEATTTNDGIILSDYMLGEYKLSMWIPDDLAGRVVGKKGVTITNLQRETKAKQINALQPVGGSLWAPVIIIGDWKAILAAYNAISDIVSGEVDDVVLEFTVNIRKPFFLYGKQKYHIVKVISAKSNVRIFVPENLKDPPVSPITLEGSFENVQRAVSLLEEEAVDYREKQKERASRKVEATNASASAAASNATKTKEREPSSNVRSNPKMSKLQTTTGPPSSSASLPPTTGAAGTGVAAESTEAAKSLLPSPAPVQTNSVCDEKAVLHKDVSQTAKSNASSASSALPNEKKTAATSVAKPVSIDNKNEQSDAPRPTQTREKGGKSVEREDQASHGEKKDGELVAKEAERVISAPPQSNRDTSEKEVRGHDQGPSSDPDKDLERMKIKVTVERIIAVPGNLVGLLLSKRNNKSSVMNQIQSVTRTTISKVHPNLPVNPSRTVVSSSKTNEKEKEKEKEKSRRRRVADENDDEDHSEGEGSDSSDSDTDNDSDTDVVEEDVENSSEETVENIESDDKEGKEQEAKQEEPPVEFRITGSSSKNVDMVHDHLSRIIAGERIKEVVEALLGQLSDLRKSKGPRPSAKSNFHSGTNRGGSERATGGERERVERPKRETRSFSGPADQPGDREKAPHREKKERFQKDSSKVENKGENTEDRNKRFSDSKAGGGKGPVSKDKPSSSTGAVHSKRPNTFVKRNLESK